jgi:hypothetical protein
MRKQRFISITLAGLMAFGQFAWIGAAAAAEEAAPSPTATPVAEEASPTSTPEATPTPTPSPKATPTPAATASPQASASPSPAAESSSAPSPTPESKPKLSDIGPNGCGGVVPDWVFDTVSGKWQAADKGSFSCDKASGYYMSPKYVYDKHSGWYEIMPADAPKPAYVLTAPNVVHTVLGDLIVGSKDYQVAEALGLLAPASGGGIAITGTGPDSNNQAGISNNNQTWMDLTNLVNVINTLQSTATSGNVTAESNTQAGNLSTGTASVLANIINLLASAWSWSNGSLNMFMQNFFGDHTGDLTLTPTEGTTGGGGRLGSSTTSNTGAGSNNVGTIDNASSLDVNAKNSGNIENNVDLSAVSGNASATSNTGVGNVGTGDAVAEVNIVNLINSFINSGSSFFGILNLFGNFNGDILFPTGFLNGLVPSSSIPGGGTAAALGETGPGSNNQAAVNNDTQANITNTSAMGVNNNIQTNAVSGAATVGQNTTAGNASSGDATTTNGLFNIANSSIFGDNAVLVIVNVLGHWVGKIMTIPGSSTSSALLTGNATVGSNATGPDSNNQTEVNNTNKANISQNSTGTITNNVKLNAQSGDATATRNTEVGNVTTGSAKAASSVANIFNTVLNVKHWFGVLVINVFGDWVGDVNHNSAAGDQPGVGGKAASQAAAAAGAGATPMPSVGLLAVLKPVAAATVSSSGGGNGAGPAATVSGDDGMVLTAAAQSPAKATAAAAAQSKGLNIMFLLSAIVMLAAGALMAFDKKLRR